MSRFRIILAVALAALALLPARSASSAASTASRSSAGISQARALVRASRAPVKFVVPGPSFNAQAAKGKVVWDIANSLSLTFTQTLTKGTKAALALAGVKDVVVDNKANVSETARLISEAVAQHASVILVQSQPSSLISAPLQKAKAAHIPVIQLFESDPRLPAKSEQALGVAAKAAFCYSCAGKLMADWTIVNSNGKANAVTYWDSDVGVSYAENKGEKAEFARLCPGCSVKFENVLVADWATRIPTLTQTDLANSSINYFLPNYDGMATFMIPAITAKNAQNRVKIVSFNADLPFLQDMKSGNVIVADLGSPVGWMGWGIADQALRLMTGHKPVADEKVPLRMFDRTNVGTLNLSGTEASWYGANYEAGYKKLWHVK
jgi:ribose transport system substrate-binding protein